MKCLKGNWTRRVLALAVMGIFLTVGAGVAAYSSIEAKAAVADRVDSEDYGERLDEGWDNVSCFGEKEKIPASSPAGIHGALRVENASLVDKNGELFRLYGMSTHGIAWFPQYVNEETILSYIREQEENDKLEDGRK